MNRLNQVDTPKGDRLRVKTATVRIPSNTANATVVAQVAGKFIYVLKLFAQCGGTATTLTFDADTNQVHDMAANGGVHIQMDGSVILKTAAVNTALKATTGVGSTTTVKVWYVETDEDF